MLAVAICGTVNGGLLIGLLGGLIAGIIRARAGIVTAIAADPVQPAPRLRPSLA